MISHGGGGPNRTVSIVQCICCIVLVTCVFCNPLYDGNTPVLQPKTGSVGNHLIHQPSAGSASGSSTLASCTTASCPFLTTHAAALVRLAPYAATFCTCALHADDRQCLARFKRTTFLLQLHRSHPYAKWTSFKASQAMLGMVTRSEAAALGVGAHYTFRNQTTHTRSTICSKPCT
jgi:hypothetical protein